MMENVLIPTEPEKIRLLIAESESLLRKNLSIIFSRESKFEVFSAKDGLEVVEILKEHDIDLIIINCILPRVNGHDIISLIRKAEQKEIEKFQSTDKSFCEVETKQSLVHYTYIIALIDPPGTNKMIELAMTSGADDFITKPFSLEMLVGKVNSAERIINLQRTIKKAYRRIQQLSTMDMLCNVYNRKSILTNLKRNICLAMREHRALAVFMLDLDFFKKINDTYGHQFGDQVLKETAHAIKDCCRSYDELGRYGGEEFLLVVPIFSETRQEINVREGAEERKEIVKSIARRVLKSVESKPHIYRSENEEKEVHITVSIGITIEDFTKSKDEITQESMLQEPKCIDNVAVDKLADQIIKEADEALYKAKENGRNTFVLQGE